MTLFTKADIPDDCQTIEQLTVWCLQILQYRYPDQTFVAAIDNNGDPVTIRKIEADDYYYTAPATPTYAYAGRVLIPLSADSQIDGKKYKYAKSFGDAEIPIQLRRVA